MLTFLMTHDYLLLMSMAFCTIFSASIYEERLQPTRPLPPHKPQQHKTRTTLTTPHQQHKISLLLPLTIWFLILSLPLLLFTHQYLSCATTNYVTTQEYTWLYFIFLFWLILSPCLIVQARTHLQTVRYDIELPMIFTLLCAQFFFCLTNIFLLLLLLECQGVALLLLLSTNQETTARPSLHLTELTTRLTTNLTPLLTIMLQYWVGFFGAALLLFAGFWLMWQMGMTQWAEFMHLFLLNTNLTTQQKPLTILLLLLFISLVLKTGVFPFHFWKPDLYNNLSLTQVFIYAAPYTATTALLAIFIFTNLLLAAPFTMKLILVANILIAAYLLLTILLNVTEIRSFLAYTSGLHLLYIYGAALFDAHAFNIATLYTLIYYLAILAMFTALLHLQTFDLKYLTDFQLFTQFPVKIFWISTALATMAGIPPLLGFWAKFTVLFNLWSASEFLLTAHLFIISLVYLYFYLAIYRFAGATNFKPRTTPLLLLTTPALINIGLMATLLHLLGAWCLPDLYNFTATWSLFFYDHP